MTEVLFRRVWQMPNKRTFSIPAVQRIIQEYTLAGIAWCDPFPYPFTEDALTYLSRRPASSVKRLLYDPPYSPRQLKECYDSRGEPLHDTTSRVWARWKDAIARVIEPGGICISFGWSSNGIGIERGFKIIDGTIIAHGGNHHDTIVTVEQKVPAWRGLMSQNNDSAKSPVLLEGKSDPSLCWVPGCNMKAEPYDLSYDEDGCYCSAHIMLCEKHLEEVVRAGQ